MNLPPSGHFPKTRAEARAFLDQKAKGTKQGVLTRDQMSRINRMAYENARSVYRYHVKTLRVLLLGVIAKDPRPEAIERFFKERS